MYLLARRRRTADVSIVCFGDDALKTKFSVSYDRAYPNKKYFMKKFETSLKPYAIDYRIFDITRLEHLEAFCEFKCIADKIKYTKKFKEFYKKWGSDITIV
jgi:hypothetical protein